MLTDPVLAFIKAYRLRGDNDGLKGAVADHFDTAAVADAKKKLWDFCKQDLTSLGLSFQSRRDSERRSQLTADLEDTLSMFESLDSVEKLPSIFCEATDLIRLPPLSLDSVAEQIQVNTKVIEKLDTSVQELKDQLTSTVSALSRDISTVGMRIERFQEISFSQPRTSPSLASAAPTHTVRHTPVQSKVNLEH